MKKVISTFLKGLCIGGTMTVPGVSGGSMAMILGIYDKMISALNKLMKGDKKSFFFLAQCAVGAILGIVLFSKSVLSLLTNFPMPTGYFFIGAVAGGVPMIYRSAGINKFSPKLFIYPIIGIVLVVLISLIPEGVFAPSDTFNFSNALLSLAGGIIVAAALVLPGISVSQMLLMLGLYEIVMKSVGSLDILPLIPLAAGVLIGTLATAKGMDTALQKHPREAYLIIFGFVLGSLKELFPGLPSGMDIPVSILTAIAGFFAIYTISSRTK